MPAKMNNQETMEVASERLQLNVNDSPLGPARIELIASTLVERAQETAQPGVFLSHYQVYGPDVMSLKLELEDTVPELRDKIWYDKDNGKSKASVVGAVASSEHSNGLYAVLADPSVDGMRAGVRDNQYFVLYLTEGVLLREFCRKEIRWAMHYKKKIVLLWKQDGNGAEASFGKFFEDIAKPVGEDDGDGLAEIFSDAAVHWYKTDEDFHLASLAELIKRLGRVAPAPPPVTFDFEDPPSVFSVRHAEGGAGQMESIERELTGRCPSLQGRFVQAPLDDTDLPPGSVVLVYLTELLFEVDGVLSTLRRYIARDVRLVWVAETDMRHGWQQYTQMGLHGWRDALIELTSGTGFNDVASAIRNRNFAAVIPYYKDSAFRRVSIQQILEALGAARYDHAPLRPTSRHIPIDFDDLSELQMVTSGAFGDVFRGIWSTGGKTVAVKTVHRTDDGSGRYASSRSSGSSSSDWGSEIEFSLGAQHPNVVQCLGVTRGIFTAGPPQDALVMEFLAQTLRQFLNEQRGPVPIATRASIAAGIVSGMLFLHLHKSVAHMDLKSHNIL